MVRNVSVGLYKNWKTPQRWNIWEVPLDWQTWVVVQLLENPSPKHAQVNKNVLEKRVQTQIQTEYSLDLSGVLGVAWVLA